MAFYGGMPRELFYKNSCLSFLQVRDVMVHPSMRGAFTVKGLFARTAERFLDEFLGKDLFESAYGFPNDRAMKVGSLSGLYDPADQVQNLTWTPAEAVGEDSILEHKTDNKKLSQKVKRRYQKSLQKMMKCQSEFLIGDRSLAYLFKRYLNHPSYAYFLLEHRSLIWGSVFIVIKKMNNNHLEIMDVIGSPKRFNRAINALKEWAYRRNYYSINGWFSDSIVSFIDNFDQIEKACVVPKPNRHGKDWPEKMHGHIWLTSGDTDFK